VTSGGEKVIGSAVNKTEYKMLFIEVQLFTEIQCLHLYDNKMVRTCKNGQNLQKWSELAKMVRTCKNGQNLPENGQHG
jgi:hypothetical protein